MTIAKRKPRQVARASDDAPKAIPAPILEALYDCAREGMPHTFAADQAGISRETLRTWMNNEREPYASFAREYRRLRVKAAKPHVRAAIEKDPVTMVSRLYGVRDPAKRTETKDTTPSKVSTMTDVELDAYILSLGYRHALPSEIEIDVTVSNGGTNNGSDE